MRYDWKKCGRNFKTDAFTSGGNFFLTIKELSIKV